MLLNTNTLRFLGINCGSFTHELALFPTIRHVFGPNIVCLQGVSNIESAQLLPHCLQVLFGDALAGGGLPTLLHPALFRTVLFNARNI